MDDVPVPIPPQPSRFMQQFRATIRARQMAYATEKTYAYWVATFIRYHGMRHPSDMGASEIEAFLSHLAVAQSVGVNTGVPNRAPFRGIFIPRNWTRGLRPHPSLMQPLF